MTNGSSVERTLAFADQLRQYAEHFEQRDWNYTRDTGSLRAITYAPKESLWVRVRARLHLAATAIRPRPEYVQILMEGMPLTDRLHMAWIHLARRERNLPDGVLDGGSIITFWEETGEYLQYVQPSVGSMLADWMEAEPDSPHAQRIADEMKRINDAYGERVASSL